MVSQHSEASNNEGDNMNSFEKIAALEAQIIVQRAQSEAEIKAFKDKFATLEVKIDMLLELLATLQTMGKVANFLEKFIVFFGKLGIAIGFMYTVYKFGLTELADKVKGIK